MKDKHHVHTYDEYGRITCCSLEEKIDAKTPPSIVREIEEHHKEDGHDHSHDLEEGWGWKAYLPAIISLILLLSGLAIEHLLEAAFFQDWIKIVWYTLAYIPVGLPVIKEAWEAL
ncbi:MAG: heavy metal translocating P-type ATPase, partial [Flavobacteriaceae bacterium]|nr:heavy metal translocating P-type ATPase [Flavobacteriaceae bacterium]